MQRGNRRASLFSRLLNAWLLAGILAGWGSVMAFAEAGAGQPAPGVVDLEGKPASPFQNPRAKAVALIFINIECPISNRYAPEIQRLQAEFGPKGVDFWLVQPDAEEKVENTHRYLKEFGYSFGLLRDLKHTLTTQAGARITPEAAVFGPDQTLLYRGRIDNRFADYNKTRPAPTARELRDALEAVVSGKKIAVARAPAIGCYISK